MRLAIGIPAYSGKVSTGHVLQMAQLAWSWCKAGAPAPLFITTDSCSIDKSRNIIVAKARDAKCDWLLMCDADTYYPQPQAIAAMLAEGYRRGAAVIGAPVKMRRRDGYNVMRGGTMLEPETFRGAVLQVDRIGTAFTAIRLDWLAANWPKSPWFAFKHIEGEQPQTIGEDIAFCDEVTNRGGLILADGRFEPAHVGATDESVTLAEIGASREDID